MCELLMPSTVNRMFPDTTEVCWKEISGFISGGS